MDKKAAKHAVRLEHTVLQTLEGHGGRITVIAFSPDGKLLASASDDDWVQKTIVRLWELATGATLQALEVGARVNRISFSETGEYLETDKGILSIQTSFSNLSPPQAQSFCNIFVQGDRITRGTENLLWLPSDYRATCSAFHLNLPALGHASGQVTVIQFWF